MPIVGTTPTGEWRLEFDGGADDVFDGGGLTDIALVVSWTGRGPLWT
ncbi:hypothetical protein Val02_64500 [Virgisporangium aliadipatigenens]|uniref:Uncharacterized protein n=1 Tax=Virgisporangium aliadipatigenens TaxID=741659 RepID=A0A8J3YPT2_9ACTN|nr:hypothetical protein [Virgisporangium aliadipatigenens]GIJ49564.1 hypothetical protein Val02_64500 [Virgisporangium aliadipatigenens]